MTEQTAAIEMNPDSPRTDLHRRSLGVSADGDQTCCRRSGTIGLITVPALKLPTEDGEPLESSWHRAEINLLIETLGVHRREKEDYYAGGNMFVYYSLEQVRSREYRGPDFFAVLDVDGSHDRQAWVVWEEGGRYPDVIVELLSPSTANVDLTTKKTLYEQTFRTGEYFCYDPETQYLRGWRLAGRGYEALELSDQGRLWSESLGLWLGLWEGRYLKHNEVWLRFYDGAGGLVPTAGEFERHRVEQETQARRRAEDRAEQEAEARRQAEAELAQLQAELETFRRQSENE